MADSDRDPQNGTNARTGRWPAINWRFIARVILKAAGLFILLNFLFAATLPLEGLGRLSLYNWLLPGRPRLPYGENPAESYNLSLDNIPAMMASHELQQANILGDAVEVD